VKSQIRPAQSVPGPDEIFGEGITLFSSSAVLVKDRPFQPSWIADYFVLKIAALPLIVCPVQFW